MLLTPNYNQVPEPKLPPTNPQVERIEKLTPAQLSRLPEITEEWIKIGLSTDPLNEVQVLQALRKLYAVKDLAPPKEVWLVPSPVALVRLYAEKINKTPADAFSIFSRDGNRCNGQHDAHWLGFYAAFREFGQVSQTEPLVGLTLAAKAMGWFLPCRGAAIVSARPTRVFVENKVLHNINGPALEYSDGFCIYRWHGLKLAKEISNSPEKLDLLQRRATMEALRGPMDTDAYKRILEEVSK